MTISISVRSSTESGDASLLQLVVSEIETQQYSNVAILTALVYHSIITIDKEVRYIWPNPRNSVSLIYFANRYIGLLGAISSVLLNGFEENLLLQVPLLDTCSYESVYSYMIYEGRPLTQLLDFITILLIDYILLMRVSALYSQSKMLDTYLKILLLLETVAGLGILIYVTVVQKPTAIRIAEGLVICSLVDDASDALHVILWSIPLAYGLLLLVLALYKAAEYWRLSHGFQGFYLVRVLVKDQIIYYGFVIFCYVVRIAARRIIDVSPIAADIFGGAASPILLCILGGHLLINLKEAGERGANLGTSFRMKTLSEIQLSRLFPS